jgi:hypothetical protein
MHPSHNAKIFACAFLLIGASQISQADTAQAVSALPTNAPVVSPAPTSVVPAPNLTTPDTSDSSNASFVSTLGMAGVTYNQSGQDLDITIDEQKTLDIMPQLEKQAIIEKVDPAVLANAPLSVSVNMIGISFTVVILNQLYGRSDALDKLHVQGFVVPKDGSPKQLCYYFDYDREMFKSLDMSSLTPQDFISKTPTFAVTNWCKTNLLKEQKARH